MNSLAVLITLMCLNIVSAFVYECNFTTHPTYGYGCNSVSITCPERDGHCGVNAHETGKDNKDVLFFMASNDDFQSFPSGLADHFPNLETINLNFSRLNHICNEDLKPFGDKLKNLLIGESEIEIVPENLFDNTPNIRHMVLNSGSIKSIHKNAFEPLKKLNSFFFKLTCEGSEIDEDARNRAQVEEQIKNLEFQCFNKSIGEPSPCKRNTTDGAGSDCSKCLPNVTTTMEPSSTPSTTDSTTEFTTTSTSAEWTLTSTESTSTPSESTSTSAQPTSTSGPLISTSKPDKKSDDDGWYLWIIVVLSIIGIGGAIVFICKHKKQPSNDTNAVNFTQGNENTPLNEPQVDDSKDVEANSEKNPEEVTSAPKEDQSDDEKTLVSEEVTSAPKTVQADDEVTTVDETQKAESTKVPNERSSSHEDVFFEANPTTEQETPQEENKIDDEVIDA